MQSQWILEYSSDKNLEYNSSKLPVTHSVLTLTGWKQLLKRKSTSIS